MLSVSSLKSFEFFNNFKLVAGKAGLYRNVANVVILDFEGIEDNYFGFQEGDFVITNLLFAKDSPERIYKSFRTLIEIGVSAFAIKTVFYSTLPDEVIELANDRKIPIFTFQDIFIEDVIINITDYLRSSTNFDYYEKLIDTFTEVPSNAQDILQFLNALNIPAQSDLTSAIYLKPKSAINEFSFQRLISKTQLALKAIGDGNRVYIIKYKNGMMFLSFYNEAYPFPENPKRYWALLLRTLSIDPCLYNIGINDSALPTSMLDISIRRCLYAYKESIKNNTSPVTYTELGMSNVIWPLLEDAYISAHVFELIQKIEPDCKSIDDFKNSSIYPTIKAYVNSNFDIILTSKELFIHQNTIRYRVKKIKDTLNVKDETFFRLLLKLFVRQ